MGLKAIWQNLLDGSVTQGRSLIEMKRIKLVNFTIVLGYPFFLLFALFNTPIFQLANLIIISLLPITFLLLRRSRVYLPWAARSILFSFMLLHIAALFEGGMANSGFLWFMLFPVLSVFLVGKKEARYWIGTLMLIVLLFFAVNPYLQRDLPYENIFLIFLVLVMIVETQYVYYVNALQVLYERELEKRVADERAANSAKDAVIIQQARLATMGEMMANIAHQWRQPLGTIAILAQNIQLTMMLEERERDQTFDEALDEINRQVRHMHQTMSDFHAFLRPDKQKVHFLVESAIEKALDMLRITCEKCAIALEYERCSTPLYINGLENEFMHLMMNLINNAKDALQERKIAEPVIRIDVSFIDEGRACIRVSDNAGGIDAQHIGRVFEPYYTTKDESRGTGLGLYMVKRIIEEGFEGTIAVENGPEGAIFTMILPGYSH